MALLDAVPVYVTRDINGHRGYVTMPLAGVVTVALLVLLNLLLWGVYGIVQAIGLLV